MTFEYVCFSITDQCNLDCPYCYRIGSKNNYISKEIFKVCVEKLKDLGCKRINISGGEPLLHPDWKYFVKLAYDLGIIVVLSTNGLLLNLNDSILKYVDLVVISLDGSNSEIDSLFRGSAHYDATINLLEKYKTGQYPFKLKVCTVMTRENISDLPNIIPIIDGKNIFWRIFYCKDKGIYNHIGKESLLERTEYRSKIDELKTNISQSITFMYDNCVEDGGNVTVNTLISADGELFVSDSKSDTHICSMYQLSPTDIMQSVLNRGLLVKKHNFYYGI